MSTPRSGEGTVSLGVAADASVVFSGNQVHAHPFAAIAGRRRGFGCGVGIDAYLIMGKR